MTILGRFVVKNKKLDDKYYGDSLQDLQNILSNIMPDDADIDFIINSIRTLLDSFKGQVHVWRMPNNDRIVMVNHFSLLNCVDNLE